MEAEGDGRGRGGGYLCCCPIPAVAHDAAPGSVVSQCWYDGIAGTVLCHGNLPSDLILRYRLHRCARSMALPQLVRGCWIL